MIRLGRGRLPWLLVQVLVASIAQPMDAHPLNGTQLEADDSIHIQDDVKPADMITSHPNDAEDGIQEADQPMIEEILNFLEVEALDRHNPALERPEGLQLMTQNGNNLGITKGQDGRISVNGSVVEGVLTLPDGTEIYTLERFVQDHQHMMGEAFEHLTAVSKSIKKSESRTFETKAAVDQSPGVQLRETLQVPKPNEKEFVEPLPFTELVSPDDEALSFTVTVLPVDEPLTYSTSVSQVTEISSRIGSSPSESSITEGDHNAEITTEGLFKDIQTENLSKIKVVVKEGFPKDIPTENSTQTREVIKEGFEEDIKSETQTLTKVLFKEGIPEDLQTQNSTQTKEAIKEGFLEDIPEETQTQRKEVSKELFPEDMPTENPNETKVVVVEGGPPENIQEETQTRTKEVVKELFPEDIPTEISTQTKVVVDNGFPENIPTEAQTQAKVVKEGVLEDIPTEISTQGVLLKEGIPEDLQTQNSTQTKEAIKEGFLEDLPEETQTQRKELPKELFPEDLPTENPNETIVVEGGLPENIQEETQIHTKEVVKELFPEDIPTEISTQTKVVDDNGFPENIPTEAQTQAKVVKEGVLEDIPTEISTQTKVVEDKIPENIPTEMQTQTKEVVKEEITENLPTETQTQTKVVKEEFSEDELTELPSKTKEISTEIPMTLAIYEDTIQEDYYDYPLYEDTIFTVTPKKIENKGEVQEIKEYPLYEDTTLMDITEPGINRVVTPEAAQDETNETFVDGELNMTEMPIDKTHGRVLFVEDHTINPTTQPILNDQMELTTDSQSPTKVSITEEGFTHDGKPFQLDIVENEENTGKQSSGKVIAAANHHEESINPNQDVTIIPTKSLGESSLSTSITEPLTLDGFSVQIPETTLEGNKTITDPEEYDENTAIRSVQENNDEVFPLVMETFLDEIPEGDPSFNISAGFTSTQEHSQFFSAILNNASELSTELSTTANLIKDLEGIGNGQSMNLSETHNNDIASLDIHELSGVDKFADEEIFNNTQERVPAIPLILSESEDLPLLYVWDFAVSHQDNISNDQVKNEKVPKTILTPEFYTFVNVVPQDSFHPLYDNSQDNVALRRKLILDYLVEDTIKPEDPRMASPGGLNVTNFGGKELFLQRDEEGYLSVNGIPVLDFWGYADGTEVYTLDDFLFDHKVRIEDARHNYDSNIGSDKVITDHILETATETMSTGVLPPSEAAPVTEAIKRAPVGIPRIPVSINKDESSLYNIWNSNVPTPLSEVDNIPITRTVISPSFSVMKNLVNEDLQHTFYADNPSAAELHQHLLLDYLVLESVDRANEQMSTADGLSVKNFNGNTLVFKSNNGTLTINKVAVDESRLLEDGTWLYVINDFLFEHKADLKTVLEKALEQRNGSNYAAEESTSESESSGNVSSVPEVGTIPPVPELVQISGLPAILDVWKAAVTNQGAAATNLDERVPKTILSPVRATIQNLLPPEKPNPLLDSSQSNQNLRIEFLRDYLVLDVVSLKDEVWQEPDGVNYTNLNGKNVNILRNSEGELQVNNIPVQSVSPLRDGTLVFLLKEFMFDHKERLEEAYANMTGTSVWPEETLAQKLHIDAALESDNLPRALPSVPEMISLGGHSSLLKFWQFALKEQERQSVSINSDVPRTVLNPDIFLMESLVPESVLDPLLNGSKGNITFWTEMVLDYLIPQPLTLQDISTNSTEGVRILNLNGKELLFKGMFGRGSRRPEEQLNVNGIEVMRISTLADGTQLLDLADLLFDHKDRIAELIQQNNVNSSSQDPPAAAHVGFSHSDELKVPHLSVPSIPLPAAITPTASQTHLWAYNQFYQDNYHNLTDNRFVKTILSPKYEKMIDLIPDDDRHPLHRNNIQRNIDLRGEFLLNYLILESVSEVDTRITQPQGLTVTNLLGNSITFVMNKEGNLIVNGVLVENIDTLDNNVKVYHLADFLFNHSEIQAITEEYKQRVISESGSLLSGELHRQLIPKQELESVEKQGHNLHLVPNIPDDVKNSGLSLVNLWQYSLNHQDISFLIADKRIPMTILSPINDKMQNIVPVNSPNPLYDESPENTALRTQFLLDYLIIEPVNPRDTRMTKPGGLKVLNLNNKELVFSTDADGYLMLSGVPVEDIQELPDGTYLYMLSDFLFDHKSLVNQAHFKLLS